jgi:hypothetical protein
VLAVQLALFGVILGSIYFDAAESIVIAGQLYKLVDAPGQVLQAQLGPCPSASNRVLSVEGPCVLHLPCCTCTVSTTRAARPLRL